MCVLLPAELTTQTSKLLLMDTSLQADDYGSKGAKACALKGFCDVCICMFVDICCLLVGFPLVLSPLLIFFQAFFFFVASAVKKFVPSLRLQI